MNAKKQHAHKKAGRLWGKEERSQPEIPEIPKCDGKSYGEKYPGKNRDPEALLCTQ
jgi:hypothetical protein